MNTKGLYSSTTVTSLVNTLNQLGQENQQLQDHVVAMTAQRAELLAAIARLLLPLTPPEFQSSTEGLVTRPTGMPEVVTVATTTVAAAPVSVKPSNLL